MKQAEAVTVPPEPHQPEPSQPEPMVKDFHPLVADAGGATEKDMRKSVPNQDAHFADPKHGVFGVFDGLGTAIKKAGRSRVSLLHVSQRL